MHAPFKLDTKAGAQPEGCGLLLSATSAGFTVDEAKTAANKGIYNCSPANLPHTAL